jgi:hypothetical protein
MYNDMWVVTCETTPYSYSLRWISDCDGAVMNVDIYVAAQNVERHI